MLQFIGSGSAFNGDLGNNGAFLKSENGKTLFMIDCGETTFSRLKSKGILDGVENVHVVITHFHPDHIGSLGTLIFYMYYCCGEFKSRVTVYTPQAQSLNRLLILNGVRAEQYNLFTLVTGEKNRFIMGDMGIIPLIPVRTVHDPNMDCFGYYLSLEDVGKNIIIYYSGDSNIIPPQVLDDLNNNRIDLLYQDVSSNHYDGNVHLSFRQLDELIPRNNKIRNKVYCMHLDGAWDYTRAIEAGFNSVYSV